MSKRNRKHRPDQPPADAGIPTEPEGAPVTPTPEPPAPRADAPATLAGEVEELGAAPADAQAPPVAAAADELPAAGDADPSAPDAAQREGAPPAVTSEEVAVAAAPPADGSPPAPTRAVAWARALRASLQASLQKMGLAKGGKREAGGPNLPTPPKEEPREDYTSSRYRELDLYAIHAPWAYVRVLYDEEEKATVYQVVEPKLTPLERTVLAFVEDTLVNVLETSPHDLAAKLAEGRQPTEQEEAKALEEYVTERFNEVLFDYSIVLDEDEAKEEESKRRLLYYIKRDFIGHGRIDVLMEDPMIEDISCDGPHQPIFLYHRKHESVRSSVQFRDDDELDSFVIKLAQRAGKHISIAEPILDATMSDGSRLQSTLAHEVSAMGSTFTIRKFRPEPFTPPDLVLFRTMSPEMLSYLWIAVQHGSSAIYAGGTASGKTTSLNAILLFIPPQMKIVSIEDTRELNLPHPNWIAGITRSGFGARNAQGLQAGEIDMFQLLKNALRQRPEYIIVGEVRGKEAYSLFQAMATGHAAYGTMHADSVDAVIHRLESEPINVPRSLLEALDIVSVQIQTRVGGKRVRRTKQLSEIVGLDPHTREILTNEVFRWQPKDDSFKYSGVSYVLERIRLEKGMQAGEMQQEMDRRAFLIRFMMWKQMRNYKSVWKLVTGYYREPEATVDKVREELLAAGVDLQRPGWEFMKGPDAAAPETGAPITAADDAGPAEPVSVAVLGPTAAEGRPAATDPDAPAGDGGSFAAPHDPAFPAGPDGPPGSLRAEAERLEREERRLRDGAGDGDGGEDGEDDGSRAGGGAP